MDETCYETGHSLSVLKNVILHEWEVLVREVIKHSRHESSIILQDHVPTLIDQLIGILKENKLDEVEVGKSHGYFRSTLTNFSIADLMTEFSLLREILVIYLYPFGNLECAMIIHKFIDILAKHSVVEFANDSILHRVVPINSIGNEVQEIKANPIIPTVN
jgi:hypothetical protein